MSNREEDFLRKVQSIELKRHLLELAVRKYSLKFSKELLSNININVDSILEGFILKASLKLYCGKESQDYIVTIKVPLNWWEQFKEEVLLKSWLTRKILGLLSPIKYKELSRTIEIKKLRFYPEIPALSDKYYFEEIIFKENQGGV